MCLIIINSFGSESYSYVDVDVDADGKRYLLGIGIEFRINYIPPLHLNDKLLVLIRGYEKHCEWVKMKLARSFQGPDGNAGHIMVYRRYATLILGRCVLPRCYMWLLLTVPSDTFTSHIVDLTMTLNSVHNTTHYRGVCARIFGSPGLGQVSIKKNKIHNRVVRMPRI